MISDDEETTGADTWMFVQQSSKLKNISSHKCTELLILTGKPGKMPIFGART